MALRTIDGGRAVSVCALVAALSVAASVAGQTQAPPQPPAAAVSAADLPSARAIVDRHIEAVGGRKAILAHSSTHMVGTITLGAAGMSGEVEGFAAKPNKMLQKLKIGGIGEVLEGFDGTVGWSLNPLTGPALSTGKELEDRKFEADFYGELLPEGRYTSMKTLEKTTFDGRECYKVSLVRPDGREDVEFYDVKTGLRAGRQVTREGPMGAMPSTMIASDYKPFGDLVQPATMKVMTGGQQIVLVTTLIEYDNVDPKVFELPAPIKALIK
jgi:hypothetical protein